MWWPRCQLGAYMTGEPLTVHSLELVDDLAEGHLVAGDVTHEPGENGTAQREFLLQIGLCPSVVIELELWWDIGIEIGVHNT